MREPGQLAEGLDWVFDLVAADDVLRAAALERHRAQLEQHFAGRRWLNRVWRQAGSLSPADPELRSEIDRANQVMRESLSRSIYGPLKRVLQRPYTGQELGPGASLGDWTRFAVLFLQWERRFPEDWRGRPPFSAWGWKGSLLRTLPWLDLPDHQRIELVELLLAAVRGPYRCEDWRWTRLATALDSEVLREGLEAIAGGGHGDDLSRLRARFVLDALDSGDLGSRRAWRRWLSQATSPGSIPGDSPVGA